MQATRQTGRLIFCPLGSTGRNYGASFRLLPTVQYNMKISADRIARPAAREESVHNVNDLKWAIDLKLTMSTDKSILNDVVVV